MKTEIKKKNQKVDPVYDTITLQSKSPSPKVHAIIFLTPILQGKLKRIAKNIQESNTNKFKTAVINKEDHLVLRSQLKIISQPIKIKIPSALMREDLTFREIQFLNVIMKQKVDEQVQKNSTIKRKLVQVYKCLEEKKKKRSQKRVKLKKIQMKLKNISVLLAYNLLMGQVLKENEQRISNKQTQIKQINYKISQIKNNSKQIQNSIMQLSIKLISCRQQSQNTQKLMSQQYLQMNNLSNNPLPNQKQLIETLFLIGILNLQIFINDLCKKDNYLNCELSDNQKIKKNKQNPNQKNKNMNKQQLEQQFSFRQIVIYKQETESIIFKFITYVYMHARIIQLNEARVTIRRISYFQEEFRQIFDFNDYELYMNILIQRLKNNSNNVKVLKGKNAQKSQNSNVKVKKLLLVVQNNYYDFVKWIMETFEQIDSYYCLNTNQMKTIVELKSMKQHLQCNKQNEASTLKIIFSKQSINPHDDMFR